MAPEAWTSVDAELPPNGLVVLTKIDDRHGVRNEATLKRFWRLWFVPDGSIYVYYTPTHWRRVTAAIEAEKRREAPDA